MIKTISELFQNRQGLGNFDENVLTRMAKMMCRTKWNIRVAPKVQENKAGFSEKPKAGSSEKPKAVSSEKPKASSSEKPKAESILKFDGNKVSIQHEVLEKIFKQKKIGDKSIAVISISGALRQGKSFMLNFLMRYLRNEGVRYILRLCNALAEAHNNIPELPVV